MVQRSTKRLFRVAAVAAVLAMGAAACGGGSSSDTDDTAVTSGDEADSSDNPDDSVDDASDTADDAADEGEDTGQDALPTPDDVDEVEADLPIQRGGSITYALESETAAGWDLSRTACPRACLQVAQTMFDPLITVDADGEFAGFLLESFEFDAERSVWVLEVRPGIEFQNGELLDAEAVALHLRTLLEPESISALALEYVESVTAVGELTVEVLVPPGENGEPAPAAGFPGQLAGQAGLVRAPAMIADPDAQLHPIGTGPFALAEWLPNDHTTVVRNEAYWLDGEDGQSLPYLDEITFRPLPEGRAEAVLSGTIDMMHSADVTDLEKFVDNDGFNLEASDTFAEPSYLMINQDSPPLDDIRIRRALALCLDGQTIIDVRSAGIPTLGNGPYAPGSIGYLADTGYPKFDPEAGMALIEEWEAENGELRPIRYGTIAGNSAAITAQLQSKMWNDCGIEIDFRQLEFGEHVESGQLGEFDMLAWRFGGGPDPSSMYQFWHSSQAQPVGESSVNFNRIRDDLIDENLDRMRSASDPDEFREAAEAVSLRFGEQVYNLWTSWTVWGVGYDDKIHQVTVLTLPGGGLALPLSSGNHFLTEAWVDAG